MPTSKPNSPKGQPTTPSAKFFNLFSVVHPEITPKLEAIHDQIKIIQSKKKIKLAKLMQIDKTIHQIFESLTPNARRAVFAQLLEQELLKPIISLCHQGYDLSLKIIIDIPTFVLENQKDLCTDYQFITCQIITELLGGFEILAKSNPKRCITSFLPFHHRLLKLNIASTCDDEPILSQLLTELNSVIADDDVELCQADDPIVIFINHIMAICQNDYSTYQTLMPNLEILIETMARKNPPKLRACLKSRQSLQNLFELCNQGTSHPYCVGVVTAFILSYPNTLIHHIKNHPPIFIIYLCFAKIITDSKAKPTTPSKR